MVLFGIKMNLIELMVALSVGVVSAVGLNYASLQQLKLTQTLQQHRYERAQALQALVNWQKAQTQVQETTRVNPFYLQVKAAHTGSLYDWQLTFSGLSQTQQWSGLWSSRQQPTTQAFLANHTCAFPAK